MSYKDYENRPLVQKLVEFTKAELVGFHVPGHKYGFLSALPSGLRSALSYDVTELTGLDDLHQPEGVIEEAQKKLSRLYESDASHFLVNGSTVGNLAMIYATCQPGDTVIVQRNAHKSIFNALELVGVKPVLITPEWDEETATVGVVKVGQVKEALRLYPTTQAVILTYPTYYGVTGEGLQDLISIAHEQSIPVLVDEAHGAHFVVGQPFPKSALALGADVVVHSAHKTLPAMTMASFLHVNSTLVSKERISKYLQMLQSSSPSYLLMASLDDARAYVESYTSEDIDSLLARRVQLIEQLHGIVGLQMVESADPLKLMMRVDGYTGFQVLKALEEEEIYVELADPYQVLLVLPLLKQAHVYELEKIAWRVECAVERLIQEEVPAEVIVLPTLDNKLTELCYTKDELAQFEVDWIPYEEAIGKVSADSVIPYPPGIPLVLAGERIQKEDIEQLKMLTHMKASFQGAIRPKEKQIFVVTNE